MGRQRRWRWQPPAPVTCRGRGAVGRDEGRVRSNLPTADPSPDARPVLHREARLEQHDAVLAGHGAEHQNLGFHPGDALRREVHDGDVDFGDGNRILCVAGATSRWMGLVINTQAWTDTRKRCAASRSQWAYAAKSSVPRKQGGRWLPRWIEYWATPGGQVRFPRATNPP